MPNQQNLKVAIYTRISTDETRQNLATQLHPLKDFAKTRDWQIYQVYTDQASGGKEDRPALKQLNEDAHKRLFDVVLVFRFDRFARSTKQLIQALETFRSLGIDFVSYNEHIDTTTPTGKIMFTIISAFADFEKEIIKERVRAGLHRAKAQGIKLGRHKINKREIEKIKELTEQGMSRRDTAKKLKISKSVVQKYSK